MKKLTGQVIIYLKRDCKHCKTVWEHRDEIREIYSRYFSERVSIRYGDESIEFTAYGFEFVPTLIIPAYRPFEAIDPSFLMDEDSLVQMINGDLLPQDVIHKKERTRREKGYT